MKKVKVYLRRFYYFLFCEIVGNHFDECEFSVFIFIFENCTVWYAFKWRLTIPFFKKYTAYHSVTYSQNRIVIIFFHNLSQSFICPFFHIFPIFSTKFSKKIFIITREQIFAFTFKYAKMPFFYPF